MRFQTGRMLTKQNLLRLFAVALAFLLMTTAAQATPVAFSQDHTSRNGLVRVRLSSLGTLNALTLNLQGAYTANNGQISLPQGTQVKVACNTATGQLTLSASGQSWNMGEYFTLNRTASNASVTIPQAGSNPYPADFSFRTMHTNGGYSLLPVAHIQMEDYLYGVLPYEMGNSAPLEALKAQAVAARTYTIRMMENRSGNSYDVVDTTADQLYKGTPSGNTNCKSAVDATTGMVLKYGSRYAETYYSSSNGGQTESAQNIWGGKGYGYLPVTDDPYDLASGAAKTKTATIYKDLSHGSNRQSLMKLLKEKAVACLKRNGYAATTANTQLVWLEKLNLHTPKYAAPSKLYTKADFTISVETVASGGSSVNTSVVVTTDVFGELEELLGMSIQSSSNEIWTLSSSDTAYTLKAGRFGHGVGMSQYGAMEMARQGFDFDEILGFYYPGCTNVKLNLSDTPMGDAGENATPETSVPETDEPDNMGNTDGTPGTSPETQNQIGYATVQANGFLNLRQSPSLNAPILGVALEGAVVKVLRLEADWAFVEYNDLQAYAMRKLLSDVYQQPVLPEDTNESPSPEDPPAEQPPATNANQAMIFCTDGFVNFREAPSLSSRVLMQVPHGASLDVLESQGEFTHVSYMGIEGYVMSSFLVKGDAFGGSSSAVSPAPSVTDEPPQQQEMPVPTETPEPPVSEGATDEETPSTPEISDNNYRPATVTTQRGSLNLREAPRDNAYILTQIPQYSPVEAYTIDNEWCAVRYNGREGYAMSRFLTFGTAPQTTPAPTASLPMPNDWLGQAIVTTKSGSLNLRMTPERNGAILRTIPQGRTVDVHSMNGEWALVSYQGYSGYVMLAYLTMNGTMPDVSPQTTPKATATPTPTVALEKPQSAVSSENGTLLPELPEGYIPLERMTAIVGAGNADFRSSPSLNDRVLHTIPVNQRFEAIACSDEWCIGIWENTVGYVRLSEIALYPSDSFQ